MATARTIEAKKYATENRMFEVSSRLADSLHAVEHLIDALQSRVHRLVCESPTMPIESKTTEVMAQITACLEEIDFPSVAKEAREVSELKAEIDAVDREILDGIRARRTERTLVGV